MAGNKNSGKRKDKAFHTALMLEINSSEDGMDLRAIARNVINTAKDPGHKDMLSAAAFIADRLDGKPVSTVDMNISDNRTVAEQTDAELAAIIAGAGSDGNPDAPDGPTQPDSVH
jgi:hypothetical protein